jgi:hypothetical protein
MEKILGLFEQKKTMTQTQLFYEKPGNKKKGPKNPQNTFRVQTHNMPSPTNPQQLSEMRLRGLLSP